MARARVRVDDLERGDLPAISVKTGRPCAHPVAIVLRPEQGLLSPTGPRIDAVLPLEPGRVRSRRVLARSSWAVLVVLAAALAAWVTGAGAVAPIAAAVTAGAYGALVVVGEARWVGSARGATPAELVLTRVHPRFARAVDEQYGRAPRG